MEGIVASRGIDLAWDRSGTGPAVIWGHGLTSSRSGEDASGFIDWTAIRRTADVVRYDARGHGESGYSGVAASYGWADLATDQLAIADALAIDRFVSGGASMGAGTALHVATRAPERVRGLVLVIPPTAWEGRAAQIDMYETMAQIVERRGVEPLLRAGATRPVPDPFVGDETWRARSDARIRSLDPIEYAGILRGAAFAQLPARDEIARIEVPALILAWTGDPGHPISTAEALDDLIGESELHLASTAADVAAWGEVVARFVARIT